MLVYSRLLTAISLGAVLVIAVLHAALLPRSRALNTELVVASARASNSLIESLRAYAAVNAMGLGTQRLAHWQHGFDAAINAETRKQQLAIVAGAGQGVIMVFEYGLFLAAGIGGVLDKQFTLGVLFAFLGLRGTLMGAASALLGAARQLYLVRSHLDRVAEVVAETPERDAPRHALRQPLCGGIACEALEFRYPGGPEILGGFSVAIDAGESIVIRGPSGSGKTTLLRLLAASLEADRGRLRYDGMDSRLWDRVSRRKPTSGAFAKPPNLRPYGTTSRLCRWQSIRRLPAQTVVCREARRSGCCWLGRYTGGRAYSSWTRQPANSITRRNAALSKTSVRWT
jgi:ATP-binding cassette subfamily B protein RaxB